MSRMDSWTVEECVLAVWAYSMMDRNRGIRKADLYAEVSRITGRSKKSVEYKVQNVSYCDKRPRAEKPISEKSNIQGLLNDVFLTYHADTAAQDDLHLMYSDLHSEGMMPRTAGLHHSGPATKYVTEGEVVVNGGKGRTRSALLRDRARDHYRQSGGGKLSCCVCGACFDDLISSGIVGTEIIQIHHLKPISESDAQPQNLAIALTQVVPVCPTCHAMIHSATPALAPDEIRSMMASHGTGYLPCSSPPAAPLP